MAGEQQFGPQPYTNRMLWEDLSRVSALYSQIMNSPLDPLKKARESVRTYKIDIPSYYREHGSIDGIKLEGAGKVAREALELILEKGIYEALKILDKQIRDKGKFKAKGRFQWGGTRDGLPVRPTGYSYSGLTRQLWPDEYKPINPLDV